MKSERALFVHLGVLVLGGACALGVWTRDKEAKALVQTTVTVWPGQAKQVERITYEGKKKKVVLEAKSDPVGRYFYGTYDHESAPAADGGAPARTTTPFVSVEQANKLTDALAPLKAIRALGRLGDDRAAEFGLDDPEATLTVKVGAVEHRMILGGPTPGGMDRYAKDPATGEVYVLRGGELRNLDSPDSALLERELHEWKDPEARTATLTVGGKVRAIVHGGTEGKRFWADAQSAETNDEALGNWINKVERLRPSEYVESPPSAKQTLMRLEYAGAKPLGWVELAKAPSATVPNAGPSTSAPKPDYFLVTERTRLYTKVPAALAEQVEQDLANLVK